VPRVEVVADAAELLQRLADGTDDPRQVALLEAPPPDGFRGTADDAGAASVQFIADEPERVVLRVRAPARGFLHLADQDFPGWQATVDGAPVSILRANYLYRAVEVPAGESTVEFRYRPASLAIGAAITTTTLLALALLTVLRRRRQGRLRAGNGAVKTPAA
jgi:membrane protein YfhO